MPFVNSTLRGVGQIFLQGNALSGAIFILGMTVASPLAALAALLGSALGTAVARLARFPAAHIADGLYGFNAALVATGVAVFYPPSAASLAAAIVGVIAATLLMRALQATFVPPYTFPFISTLWLIFWLLPLAPQAPGVAIAGHPDWLHAVLHGVSQVTFLAHPVCGLLFVLALAVNSRRSAVLALLAALLGTGLAAAMAWPAERIEMGIYGYNAVLTAIACGLACRHKLQILGGSVLAVFITQAFLLAGLPALTFPFVAATWITLGTNRLFRQAQPAAST